VLFHDSRSSSEYCKKFQGCWNRESSMTGNCSAKLA
jgi:hypothetical protein